MRFIAVLLSALALAGCSATPYQPMASGGGYDNTQVSPDSWRIRTLVNKRSGISRADDFSLLRAAELACEGGYHYFDIIEQSYGRNQTTRVRNITVKLTDSPDSTHNAETILKNLSEKLETETKCRF